MNNIFNGGAILDKSKKLFKDTSIASFNPKLDTVEKKNFMLKFPQKDIIIDQSIYNACVAHSISMCASILEYNRSNKWIDFDPFVIYGTVYADQYKGMGMIPTEAIHNCMEDGLFFRRDFNKQAERPQIVTLVNEFKKYHPELEVQAKNYRFSAACELTSNDSIINSLKLGIPVSVMYPVYDSFYSVKEDGIVPIPDTNIERLYGNHQMTIVGIRDDNKFIVVNSYGSSYGFKGLYYIPMDWNFLEAYMMSDTITPAKPKAEIIELIINDNNITIDGIAKKCETAPVIINDRTYLPVRIITEALGASVEWIQSEQKVIVRSEEAEITLKIGSNKYTIDGSEYNMDTAPVIINDSTMLPIRFIAEALNCDVDYKFDDKQKIIIKSK